MEGESGVTRRIFDELLSSYIRRDQMDGKGGITRSIIDALHFSEMVTWKVGVGLLEVSLI